MSQLSDDRPVSLRLTRNDSTTSNQILHPINPRTGEYKPGAPTKGYSSTITNTKEFKGIFIVKKEKNSYEKT